ncbi:AAC(3) family N-acetyltransferase [Streptomyces nitrosporeus]|uniref:AAC(3) family N-acetyltransferase n=1 Tax=Streptomyces nitrosporeus TaxID=28894 RepID=UPI00332327AF
MRVTEPRSGGLTGAELVEAWRTAGLREGVPVIVHPSLSGIGHVDGGAATVAGGPRTVLGTTGTLVAPAFTRQVADRGGGWTGHVPEHRCPADRTPSSERRRTPWMCTKPCTAAGPCGRSVPSRCPGRFSNVC